MNPARWQQVQELFEQVVSLPPAERTAFLAQACDRDEGLRAEVESLIEHDALAGAGFMNIPVIEQGPEIDLPSDSSAARHPRGAAPTRGRGFDDPKKGWPAAAFSDRQTNPGRIGPYHILERIGEGAMGEVFRAEQTTPVARRVALKLLKLGMDTKEVLARFEAERQALAMMDHEGIARIFDAGTTEQGRSYFVMEDVAGVPITDHCDRHRLTIEERLRLFIRVCEAVQHAHQKGIIHRDLKPSNILVAYADGKAVPKVIDFGVAKALNKRLTEQTLFTEQGQLIGTPEYMSPEQAEMTGQNIDTTSDIYSLGVLLYELLTGTLPFDSQALRRAAFDKIVRIIRDVDPVKPSTRLSTLGRALPTEDQGGEFPSPNWQSPRVSTEMVAKCRGTVPKALRRRLRGDLDWITMRCLEKDRSRRYATASELAADVQRHLNHEPVAAGPPSLVYRTRKLVRRNRGMVIGATAFVMLLLAFASYAWIQAGRNQGLAESERAAKEHYDEAMGLASRLFPMIAKSLAQADFDKLVDARREIEAAVREHTQVAGSDVVQSFISQVDRAILQRARIALDTNRVGPLVRRIADDSSKGTMPSLIDLLPRFKPAGEGEALTGELREYLEQWIRVRYPAGRGQEMRDCLKVLRMLDPRNRRAAEVESKIDRCQNRMNVVFEQNYESLPDEECLAGWTERWGVEEKKVVMMPRATDEPGVVEQNRAIQVASSGSCVGALRYDLEADCHDSCVTLELTLRITDDSPDDPERLHAEVTLEGREHNSLATAQIQKGRFVGPESRSATTRLGPVHEQPAVRGRDYHIELRYYQEYGRYDVLVDGDFLVEDATCQAPHNMQAVKVGAAQATKVLFDDVVLRRSEREPKVYLGEVVPRIVFDELGLDAASRLPAMTPEIVIHDFDGDGRPEIASGDAGEKGVLRFYRVRGPDFDCRLARTLQLNRQFTITPCAIIGGRLAVFGLAQRRQGNPEAPSVQCGYGLLEVSSDLNAREVFSRYFDKTLSGPIISIRFGLGRSGFAAGMSYPYRLLELFEERPAPNGEPFVQLGRYELHRPDSPIANDIISLAASDLDGDGADELFVGLDHWNGYCPAMVKMSGGRPEQNPPSAFLPKETDDAQVVFVRPLTDQVGRTRLAILESGPNDAYLIAASLKSRMGSNTETQDYGLRVWHLPGLQTVSKPEPIYDAGHARAVAVGELAGRQVFGTIFSDTTGPSGEPITVIRVCGIAGGKIETLWKARIPCRDPASDLYLADVNGDGQQELLVHAGEQGVYVFSSSAAE